LFYQIHQINYLDQEWGICGPREHLIWPASQFPLPKLEREREFIGTNIKQFHAKIKLRRWDTEKNLQNRLSRRAPLESFINFSCGLKLMAELVRI